MREYPVTTNTDIVLALSALTVTVRSAFYNPPEVLAPRGSDEGQGRETWKNGKPALPFFKMSGLIKPGEPVILRDVTDLDGKKVQAKSRSRKAGVAATDVRSEYALKSREVGEAQIPLWDLGKGSYLLAIVAPEKEQTKPDAPSGPKTTIEAGVQRTYRPLYVELKLDDELRLIGAATVFWEKDQRVYENPWIYDASTKKRAGHLINHGYVTAFSASELAIDWKPDFVRTVRTDDGQKGAAESETWKRHVDMIVVHGTGGAILGPALNTALGEASGEGAPFGPHYELDLDGHNLKFAYDDAIVSHAGVSRYYDLATKDYVKPGYISVGIEVVNRSAKGKSPQEPYREPQIRGLIDLLKDLARSHPKVKRHRIVGHSDIRTNDAATILSDDRISCPGRQMQWPRLEQSKLGRACVEKTLTAADYSGFFGLVPADFPKKFPNRPQGDDVYLREGDGDGAHKWGGVTWTKTEAKELLTSKALTFKGIVREVQEDLQTLGYFLKVNGELDAKTAAAVKHFIWRTFSGDRRGLVPGGNGNNPKVWVTPVVARYLKGSAELVLADVVAASSSGGGAGDPASAHAELSPELTGDMHDRVAEAEADEEPDEDATA
jgi:N-acetyl-anhydromuramyl-L-alanine amidase AmpD